MSTTAQQPKMGKRVYSQPPTTRLAIALTDGRLKYPRMKTLFVNMLRQVSGHVGRCEESEARSIFCANLWSEIGDLLEAHKEDSPEMADLHQAAQDRYINFDEFFDSLAERMQPVFFAYGKKGEEDIHSDHPQAVVFWYCALSDAPKAMRETLAGKVKKEALDDFIKDCTGETQLAKGLGEDMIMYFGPCFRARERTRRFCGKGKVPDLYYEPELEEA